MIDGSKNKMQNRDTIKEFHFAGAGVHEPITISAATREEAEKILHERLQPPKVEKKLEENK